MSWAGERRAMIILVASLVALALILILGFSILYETPTCTDKKQNQDEAGIDCGGSCTTLCSFQVQDAPVIRLVRALTPQPGRTDVIAYIENRNTNAEAANAPFLVEVYGTERQIIAKKTIQVDLPPSTSVPIYLADVAPRGSVAAQAFITPVTEEIVWKRASGEKLVLPTVEGISITEGEAPRITAMLVNPLARTVYNTTLIATVFDISGNAMAASQTFVPTLPPQGSSPLVFTWNALFPGPVSRVEILPVPVLNRAP